MRATGATETIALRAVHGISCGRQEPEQVSRSYILMAENFGFVFQPGREFAITRLHAAPYPAHLHTTFELMIMLRSAEQVAVGGSLVNLYPGDLIAIAPDVLHERRTLPSLPLQYCVMELDSRAAESALHSLDFTSDFVVVRAAFSADLCRYLCSSAERRLDLAAGEAFAAFQELLGRINSLEVDRCHPGRQSRPIGDDELRSLRESWGVSEGYFFSAFRARFGITPHQLRLNRRLDRARAALLATDLSIAEVALDNGFYDQAHFTRLFKRTYLSSPAAYRQAICIAPT